MNIVVCIKQVPDSPNIRIDRERMTIIWDGVESITNPLDRVALEAALDLKQKEGGKITVLTMGPSQSEEALREALAAGADEAILLTDRRFAGADTLATSKVIASAISKMDPFPDLILSRAGRAEKLGIEVGLLVNSASLERLARQEPAQAEQDLARVLKGWQREAVGEDLRSALGERGAARAP